MSHCQQQIATLLPKTKKGGKNAALGVAGWFLIVPWFFMDFSKAEQIEVDAWRSRYNHLAVEFANRGCGTRQQMPTLQQLANDEQLAKNFSLQVEEDQAWAKDKTPIQQTSEPKSPSSEYQVRLSTLIELYMDGLISKEDFTIQLDELKSRYSEDD
jgi:hypothetical protein